MLRIGIGYDIHRLETGRRCVIGGVDIPHPVGLAGHSDADVLLHAICDALLGAAGLGDLGHHFPDHDPKWKNASSLILLREVAMRLAERKASVVNLDAVIIAEAPRMAPHIEQMRENIAAGLGIRTDQVSVKATTNEQIGSIGRGEGIAAQAVCLLNLCE